MSNFNQSDRYLSFKEQKNIGIPLLNAINRKNNPLQFSKDIKSKFNGIFSPNGNKDEQKQAISSQKIIRNKRLYSPQIILTPSGQSKYLNSQINRNNKELVDRYGQIIVETMPEETFKFRDKVIQSLEREIKNLKESMKNINREKQEKYSFYESRIITQIRKNQQLKDSMIQDLKRKIIELEKQINYLNLENLKILEQLSLTKQILHEKNIQLNNREEKFNQFLAEYQKTIQEKELIIKKMSFFNDQLCLKIINSQGLISSENNYEEEIKQKTIQKQKKFIDSSHNQDPNILKNNNDLFDTYRLKDSKEQSINFTNQFQQSKFLALNSLIQERSLQKIEQFQGIKHEESRLSSSLMKNLISTEKYKKQDSQLSQDKKKYSYQFNIKKCQGKLLFNYQKNNYSLTKNIIRSVQFD